MLDAEEERSGETSLKGSVVELIQPECVFTVCRASVATEYNAINNA